ncbi:hypothetical protein VNO77_03435 [Canavalia gladiata]|uniref:Uncharacterized protein n=1 Tax=Canavalia gladiata TaxID=3824 RepID=A0AAN9MUW2_CANGL
MGFTHSPFDATLFLAKWLLAGKHIPSSKVNCGSYSLSKWLNHSMVRLRLKLSGVTENQNQPLRLIPEFGRCKWFPDILMPDTPTERERFWGESKPVEKKFQENSFKQNSNSQKYDGRRTLKNLREAEIRSSELGKEA